MKEFLSRHHVDFSTRLLTHAPHLREVQRRGIRNGPLTLVGSEAVVGFDPQKLRSSLERAQLLSADQRSGALPRAGPAAARIPPLSSGAVAVACFLDDAVTFLAPGGQAHHAGTQAESRLPVEGHPIAVEPCPLAGRLAVVSYAAGSVSFLSLEDGAFARGTQADSSLETGPLPLYALAHPSLPLLYVSNSESRDLSVLDPARIAYAFGSRARSTFRLPGQPGVMAIDPAGEILYVRLREGAVVMLRADSLAPLFGDLPSSTFATGRGRGIALSADGERVFVPEALGDREGLGVYPARAGASDRSESQPGAHPSAAVPFAIAAHPRRPIIYLSCFESQVVELRDAVSGGYLHSTAARSSLGVGSGARAMLVDPDRELLYVSCFDDGTVLTLDATRACEPGETRAATSVNVGRGPRGLALVP